MAERIVLFVSKNAPATKGDNKTVVVLQGRPHDEYYVITQDDLTYRDPEEPGTIKTIRALKEKLRIMVHGEKLKMEKKGGAL